MFNKTVLVLTTARCLRPSPHPPPLQTCDLITSFFHEWLSPPPAQVAFTAGLEYTLAQGVATAVFMQTHGAAGAANSDGVRLSRTAILGVLAAMLLVRAVRAGRTTGGCRGPYDRGLQRGTADGCTACVLRLEGLGLQCADSADAFIAARARTRLLPPAEEARC